MNCPRCSDPAQEEWNYCPKCGARIKPLVLSRVLPRMPGAKIRVNLVKNHGFNPLMVKHNENLQVLEPLTRTEKGVLIVEVPGVENPQNIMLRRVKDSLEINAYTKDKRYFKIINLEGKSVKNHSFKDEELSLVIQ